LLVVVAGHLVAAVQVATDRARDLVLLLEPNIRLLLVVVELVLVELEPLRKVILLRFLRLHLLGAVLEEIFPVERVAQVVLVVVVEETTVHLLCLEHLGEMETHHLPHHLKETMEAEPLT
jgi:hypothetical protein